MTLTTLRTGGFLAALLLALAAAGCSGSSGAASSAAGGGPGAGGSAGMGQAPDSLAFDPSATVTLIPGATRELALRATPPGAYHVDLALLGAFADASLDTSETETAPDGTAHFTLVAPTSPTTFSVRASVGSAVSTSVAVSVSAGGFASVQITPDYPGKRPVSFWIASVHAGTTCAALPGTPPPDGDLVAQIAAGHVGQIDDVPVGPVLAVTVRSGHFAGGCVDVTNGVSGDTNPITVPVIDRPIQLADTVLDVKLGLDGDSWQNALASGVAPTAQAMLGTATNDVSAVLDGMQAAAADASEAEALAAARQANNWDQTLATALGASTQPSMLRAQVKQWMTAGIAALGAPDTFKGRLTAASPGQAELDLVSIGGLDPANAGFPVQNLVSWNADANDTVALGAGLTWLPSRLLTALAAKIALASSPAPKSLDDALASAAGCDKIAAALTAQGQQDAVSGCDAGCVATLCQAAVTVMWQRARDASGTDWSTAAVDISATGAAKVDDVAAPLSFDGKWVGKLGLGQDSLSVGGPASGTAPNPK